MGRGINVLSADPIWTDPQRARFKFEDFKRIREGGFRTVRLNLHGFAHMNDDGALDPAWLETLDRVVQAALAADLIVILDEHDYSVCDRDVARCQRRLTEFWLQIADRYKSSPNTVLFEILNEPHGVINDDNWNVILRATLRTIRLSNPTRNVIIGPAFYNSIHHLVALTLPSDDNIIVTVHYYDPMSFTHQGARWNPATAALSGVSWGTRSDYAHVFQDLAQVQTWATAHNRPILLGEFGAYERGDLASRVRYTAAVARTAEAMGWAWAYWQFDGDFIAFDVDRDEWVKPIWQALTAAQP